MITIRDNGIRGLVRTGSFWPTPRTKGEKVLYTSFFVLCIPVALVAYPIICAAKLVRGK